MSIRALLERATLRDKELEKERDIMEEVENKVDQTPWIRRTRWPKIFVGRDMKILANGTQEPKKDALLEMVWTSVLRVLRKRCMQGIKDCNDRGWSKLLFWLPSVDAIKPEQKPFREIFDPHTLRDYSQTWAGLTMLCLRSLEMPHIYRVPLSTNE